MTLHFKIDGQTIERLDKNKIASDSAQYVLARFDVSSDWNMKKLFTPLFRVGAVSYTPELREDGKYLDENNICVVPHECLQNSGVVSVSAFLTDGNKRITTAEVQFVVEKSGFADATASIEPTQDKYEKILESYAEFKQSAFLKGEADLKLTDRLLQLTANGEAVGGGITLPDFDKFELWNDITLQEDVSLISLSQTDGGKPLKVKKLFLFFLGKFSETDFLVLRFNNGTMIASNIEIDYANTEVGAWVYFETIKKGTAFSIYPKSSLRGFVDGFSQGVLAQQKELKSSFMHGMNADAIKLDLKLRTAKMSSGSRILVWGMQDDE